MGKGLSHYGLKCNVAKRSDLIIGAGHNVQLLSNSVLSAVYHWALVDAQSSSPVVNTGVIRDVDKLLDFLNW